jgi:hypothetical protein
MKVVVTQSFKESTMKLWQLNQGQDQGSHVFTLAASAAIMAAMAVAASVAFVSVIGLHAAGNAPPEHEVKSDLFETIESQANSAAASFLPRSTQSENLD